VGLVACSSESRVIGKWSDGRNNATLEFLSGGTCNLVSEPSYPTTCTWEMSGDRIVMHESILNTTVTMIGHFEGDDLVFIAPDNRPLPAMHRIT
jgi:hypothetical protein